METATTPYLESLLQGHGGVLAAGRGWLDALRAEALEQANSLSVPTTRDEEWRYTDLTPLYKTRFERARAGSTLGAGELERFTVPEAGARLTFIDGHFAPALSAPLRQADVTVEPLARAMLDGDLPVREHLGRHVPLGGDPFPAVNTAWLHDGAVVHIRAGRAVGAPIHLVFVSTQPHAASYPRVLVMAERNSDCTVIEDFVAVHEGACLTNAVTEIAVGDNARVQHARLQRESLAAFHIATAGVRLARDARYTGTSIALGARLSRYNLNIVQAGEGAECRVDGLALIAGRQLADTHSFIDHARPGGNSRQVHKCIVDGAAHAVFNGKILVRPGAQLTDSSQQSRNLLLSERAHVDTKPQLEIFADDVKCAHGAAVGQLEADQIFYLRSRGLSERAARELLTFAFAAEIVERIPVASVVQRLEQAVIGATQARTQA
jgi:Fe-S cluster assembly protein SufD